MARLQGKQLVPTVGVGEEIVELENQDSDKSHQENKELESLEVLSSNKFIFSLKWFFEFFAQIMGMHF